MRTTRLRLAPLHIGLLFALLVVVGITVKTCSHPSVPELQTKNGVINLAGRTTGVPLSGKWGFWPGAFIDPALAAGVAVETADRMETFPASWTRYSSGQKLSPLGYGSYAIRLEGLDPSIAYAMRIPAYYSAARYYLDGEEIAAQGVPATTAFDEVPYTETLLVPLPQAGKTSSTLVIHISNFNAVYPAGSAAITLGSYEQMRLARLRSRLFEVILFGAFIMLGAYFIAFYFFRQKDRSCLWFGLFLVVFAVKIGCTGEILIRELISQVSGGMVFRIGFCTYAAAQAFFCAFIRLRYPLDARTPVFEVSLWSSAALAVCIITITPIFFISIVLSLYTLTLITAFFSLLSVFRAALRRDSGAMLFLAGFLLFFFFVAYDLLVGLRLISGVYLAPVGSFLLVTAMTFAIMREIGWAFTSLAAVSRRLSAVNESLTRFIPTELHAMLGKHSITDVCLGDNATHPMCVMSINPGLGGSVSMLEVFNDLLPRLVPVIQGADGFIDSYAEDGILALFADDPVRVVSCAAEICALLDAAFELDAAAGIVVRKYAIGIHRGEIFFGTIGDTERIGHMVVSDALETARRLMEFGVKRGFSLTVSGEIITALDIATLPGMKVSSHGVLPSSTALPPVRVFEVSV